MLRELKVVEQRYRAVLGVLDGSPVTEVAERFGVARQTVHRWVARYRDGGPEEAIRVAGREPPSQIGFYINQLFKKEAIRRVAYGKYRPGPFTATTKPFFPEGYTEAERG
jgi:transposase